MTKEIHDINTRALDFVVELIEYIFEYPDDDYMTMECLCRKLNKYELVDEKDGFYLVAGDALRKTEPTTEDCSTVEDEPQTEVVMPKKCKDCDSASKIIEAYTRGFEDGADAVKAIPQTFVADGIVFAKMDEPQICDTCRFDDKYGDESICSTCSRRYSDCYEPKDEPQTEGSSE